MSKRLLPEKRIVELVDLHEDEKFAEYRNLLARLKRRHGWQPVVTALDVELKRRQEMKLQVSQQPLTV